jgi:hypothetical protein
MPTQSGELNLLEQSLLEWSKVKLSGWQFKLRAAAHILRSFSEDGWVVRKKVAALPVRLEYRGHLRQMASLEG